MIRCTKLLSHSQDTLRAIVDLDVSSIGIDKYGTAIRDEATGKVAYSSLVKFDDRMAWTPSRWRDRRSARARPQGI